MAHVYNGILLSHKKKRNGVIYSEVDGPRFCHTEWSKLESERKLQVGTGDRSEKIRTYNFPQGRITDHRIKHTVHQLEAFLDGDLDEMIDALITFNQAEMLASSNED